MVAIDGNGGVGIGTTANGYDIRTNGDGIFVGSGGTYFGDGSGLYGLLNDSLFSGVTSGLGTGIHPISNFNVGIGTTVFNDTFTLQLGSPGTGKTDLLVNNKSRFLSTVDFESDVNITGKLNLTNFDIDSSTSNMTVGILTATEICVGTGCTILAVKSTGIGINSTQPSAALDVVEPARLQSTYEIPKTVTSSSNVITLKLDEANTFLHSTTENVNKFVLEGVKAGSSASFTIKIVQGSTPRTVAVDSFETTGGSAIPVYWPGGVIPVLTNTGAAIDVYSYVTFDGGTSLYGVVGGQNFS